MTVPALRPAQPPALWSVQLLGGLRAEYHDGRRVEYFGSRPVAVLLARLALYPRRSHSREELIELLWPGVGLAAGRNRLRQALFTLRQVLEPAGAQPAPVIVADRLSVRLVPGTLDCDVLRFDAALRAGHGAEARALYLGELLPGFYDEWIEGERRRLATAFEHAAGGVAPPPPAEAAVWQRRGARSHATALGAEPAAPSGKPEEGGNPGLANAGTAAPGPASSGASAARMPAGADAVDVRAGLLPLYLTRFFGRASQAARLRLDVLGQRLVTLLGPGGSGKTRLAVALAESLREAQPAPFDFVGFVSLVGCDSRAQLLDALLAGLHLRQAAGDPLGAVEAALAGRRAMLVLDNVEQLAGHAEHVVAQLIALLPGLHLLVTSRRVLGLDGEREFLVEPLELPGRGLAPAEAALVPAVALFVDRARAVRADFHIGPRNLDAVVEIVHRLEGMPLAIELAAARVRSIAPVTMAGLLRAAQGRTLELLQRSGPRHGLDRRHASMLSVVAWSWRLLAPAQARLLAALTVFHGGFTAQAADAVCGALAQPTAVHLDELVAQSLLQARAGDSDAPTRYQAFEPVREYAAAQLDADTRQALRAAHRAWLAEWATGLAATPALAEVRAEMPNLLAGLASALADAAPADALRFTLPLRRALEDVEMPADGLTSLADAVEGCDDPDLQLRGRVMLGPLLHAAGRPDQALATIDRLLAQAPAGSASRAAALHAAARVRYRSARRAALALPLLDEAEPLARAAGDIELQARIHSLRAFVVDREGEHAAAERWHAEALALWQRLGNQHAVNSGRYHLAACAQNAGRHHDALTQLAEVERSTRALHDHRRLGQTLNVRGNAYSELGRWPEALACFRESLRLASDHLALYELAFVLWNLPRALAHLRRPEAALQLAAFAAAFWAERFGRLDQRDRHDLRRVRRLVAVQRVGAAQRELLWARGERLSLAEALALAARG